MNYFDSISYKKIDNKKRLGFTLAEVLITLVIVGVIAAVTIPALVNNFRFSQYRAGVLKAMSVLNQAVLKYKIDNGENPQCGYFNKISGQYRLTDCRKLYDYFTKNLNIQKYCSSHAYLNGCMPEYDGGDTIMPSQAFSPGGDCLKFQKSEILAQTAFITTDGMIFFPYSKDVPIFVVDVNGFKGPNKYGYDMHFIVGLYYSSNPGQDDLIAFQPTSGACTFFHKGGIKTSDLVRKTDKY